MALPDGMHIVRLVVVWDRLTCTSQYFGRDSLIALRLLMPTLTFEAIESALGAVIERTNATGALCHEETIGESLKIRATQLAVLMRRIGDYASFVSSLR